MPLPGGGESGARIPAELVGGDGPGQAAAVKAADVNVDGGSLGRAGQLDDPVEDRFRRRCDRFGPAGPADRERRMGRSVESGEAGLVLFDVGEGGGWHAGNRAGPLRAGT